MSILHLVMKFIVLRDSPKAKREVELHWSASGCKNIVSIIDVYQNTYKNQASLLIIMV